MRYLILATSMLLYAAIPAHAQVSVGIQSHGVSIGFNVSAYPRMVAVPGYPVYYDPQMHSNYFFYDGLYWVYQDNNWYSSGWYDGPWDQIGPQYVPAFVLRVPVRYYGQRPAYFAGWSVDVAPHWGEYWGNDWQQQRSGWDSWDRHSVPQAAPLPSYQAQYSGSRYPRAVDQQYSIQSTSYHYQPREAVAQQYYQQHVVTSGTRNATVQQAPSQQQSHGQQQQKQERARIRHSSNRTPSSSRSRSAPRIRHNSNRMPSSNRSRSAPTLRRSSNRMPSSSRSRSAPTIRRNSNRMPSSSRSRSAPTIRRNSNRMPQQQQKQERANDQAQQQSHAKQQQQQQRSNDQAQQQSHAKQQQQQQRSNDQAQQQSHAKQQQQQRSRIRRSSNHMASSSNSNSSNMPSSRRPPSRARRISINNISNLLQKTRTPGRRLRSRKKRRATRRMAVVEGAVAPTTIDARNGSGCLLSRQGSHKKAS